MKSIIFAIYKQFVTLGLGSELSKNQTLSFLHAQIVSILKPECINFEGFKIFLDKNDSRRLTRSSKDTSLETKVIRKVVKKGDTVLDIGAHIGYFSLVMASLVESKGKVYAFEPSRENLSLLKKNIIRNGFKNVALISNAVGNYQGNAKLYHSKTSSADHSLSERNGKQGYEIVKVISIDNYFKNYKGKIDFIKIDVQGYEGQVILGALKLIKKNPHIKIISEFWPRGLKMSGLDPKKYLNLITSLGFKIYNLDEWEGYPKLISPQKLLKKYTTKNNLDTNLFCTKSANRENLFLKQTKAK